MAHQERVQIGFAGVKPNMAEHLVSDNELVSATNIDFSDELGAASVRRGSNQFLKVAGESDPTFRLKRAYQEGLAASRFFARIGATVYQGSTSLSLLMVGLSGSDLNSSDMGFTTYRDEAFLGLTPSSASMAVDTLGTGRDWVLDQPGTAPTVVINTLGTLAMITGTWAAAEGTIGAVSTATETISSTDVVVVTSTGTADSSTKRLTLTSSPSNPNMNVNSGNTIGDYGITYISVWIDEPSKVDKLSLQFQIGTNAPEYEQNRYTAKMDVVLGETTLVDPVEFVDALLEKETNITLTAEERENIVAIVREGLRVPVTHVNAAKGAWTVWAIPRPLFKFEGNRDIGGWWNQVGLVSLTVEARSTVEVRIKNHYIKGAETYPLSDANVGYAYWVSHARLPDGTLVLQESAPSPASTRITCQGSRNVVTDPNSLATWATHRIFYTQGGYLRQPYAFATVTTTLATHDQRDVALIGLNQVMEPNVRADTPNNIKSCSEPFHDRIFVAHDNLINWTKPGEPGIFPVTSVSRVSHFGDQIQALITWAPGLVIVNRDSVYEMHGTIFEGSNSDWVLQRTGSRHGSGSVNVPIKTPYGIPLIDSSGFYMYQPGQGVDQPIAWAQEVLKDAFRGRDVDDPAIIKGNRVPAINLSNTFNASCAYFEDKLYLAVPTGSDTHASTVFVLDFHLQQVWWYEYPFDIYSMFWDTQNNRLLAGTTNAAIMQIEAGVVDENAAATPSQITYSLRTKRWSTPTEAVLENMQIEYEGGPAVVKAILDGTTTTTLGTVTNTVHDWEPLAFNGTVRNSIQFQIDGTREGTADRTVLYGIAFDALYEPARVKYFKTDYFDNQHKGEKYWDVDVTSIEIPGSDIVTKVSFIDGTAVMTNTCAGPTSGQEWFHHSYNGETYGDIAYTTYTSTGEFKLWQNKWFARNEPPPVNTWKSDIESLEENIIDAIDVDINPNGTTLSIAYVDNAAISTATFTGTKRQSYTHALPNETYGRTLYAQHNGTGFKHYQTWFHKRPQPDRWTNFVSDRESGNEQEIKTVESDLDCLGNTVLGTAFVNGTAVGTYTFTGSERQSYVEALPAFTFGRTRYMKYVANSGKFKHYRTWWEGTDEPDRIDTLVTDEQAGNEQEIKTVESVLDCLNNTITGITYIDGVATSTNTYTGNGVKSFVDALPLRTYGRVKYVIYTGTGFKHYKTWFEGQDEPDRIDKVRFGPIPFLSSQQLRTWLPELDTLNSVVLGTVIADSTAIATGTFNSGTAGKTIFQEALDLTGANAIETATQVDVEYNGTSVFKHYNTKLEVESRPFGKKEWSLTYKKLGGATELDMARFWNLDVEAEGTATITSMWDYDNGTTNTQTHTVTGREYVDRLSFPPGVRSRLWQTRLWSSQNFQVFKSNLDIIRQGKTGLTVVTIPGVPVENQKIV